MHTWLHDTRGRVTILALALGTVFLLALVVGFLADVPQGDVPPAYAACHTLWPACAGSPPDNTRTSTLWVDHRTGEEYLIPVEPQTGENWDIDIHWSPTPGGLCNDVIVGLSAAVDWVDGTGWTVSCTGCNPTTGPVFSIGICSDGGCNIYNAWSYVLKLDLLTRYGGGNLSQAVYTTTSVDDGVSIDYPGTCNEDTAVSPTSQTWSQGDTTFPCSLDCNYDATAVIRYE